MDVVDWLLLLQFVSEGIAVQFVTLANLRSVISPYSDSKLYMCPNQSCSNVLHTLTKGKLQSQRFCKAKCREEKRDNYLLQVLYSPRSADHTWPLAVGTRPPSLPLQPITTTHTHTLGEVLDVLPGAVFLLVLLARWAWWSGLHATCTIHKWTMSSALINLLELSLTQHSKTYDPIQPDLS